MHYKEYAVNYILDNIKLFRVFKHVFIFGSTVTDESVPNDLDMLLIYDKYSDEILYSIKQITENFKLGFLLPLDLTVLSVDEAVETEFMQKICKAVFQIK